MHAVVFAGAGGPEVITIATVPTPEPGPGQIRVRVRAYGLYDGKNTIQRVN
jgi:NADPH:quinone reductase-like Zn-dependent oxidoreductase